MTTKIVKYAAIALILTTSLFSCTKKDEEPTIIGKWKLVEVKEDWDWFGEPKIHDYSQYNIVYEFKNINILLVSGKTDNISLVHGNGEHSYTLFERDWPYTIDKKLYYVEIDRWEWSYNFISTKELVVEKPDLVIYKFIKLK